MDDIKSELKLSQQLVMTPQLQMAIRMLATPSGELQTMIDKARTDRPGTLRELAPGESDPAIVEMTAMLDEGEVGWEPLDEGPLLPPSAGVADVWVFGNPPQVRANGRAYPRYAAVDGDREAKWLVRAFHQRARTYEKIVNAVVERRPEIAISLEPAKVPPMAIREISEAVGMHESTITRVATGCRFQNLHGLIAFTTKGKKLGFQPV